MAGQAKLTLEQFAALSAQIDVGVAKDEMLRAARVTPEAWDESQAVWLQRMADQSEQGRFSLSERYAKFFAEHRAAAALRKGKERKPLKGPLPTAPTLVRQPMIVMDQLVRAAPRAAPAASAVPAALRTPLPPLQGPSNHPPPMQNPASPFGQPVAPYTQGPAAPAPLGQSVSPYSQAAAHLGQSVSPYAQAAAAPLGQSVSPYSQAAAPLGQSVSPYSQVAAAPFGQSVSPYSQVAATPPGSPHAQQGAPHAHQGAAPLGQSVSPYSQAAMPPSRPPGAHASYQPILTVEQFASLRAELVVSPEDQHADIRTRYKLDASTWLEEEAVWQRRFSTDKPMFQRYLKQFQYMRGLLAPR